MKKTHVSVPNDVIVSCQAAAGRYETAISVLGDKGLRDKFRDIAETKKQTAIHLEEALKSMEDIPKESDPEKEALKNPCSFSSSRCCYSESGAMATR